jgi:hypothetical protein
VASIQQRAPGVLLLPEFRPLFQGSHSKAPHLGAGTRSATMWLRLTAPWIKPNSSRSSGDVLLPRSSSVN